MVRLGAEINLGLTSNQIDEQSRRWDDILFGEGGARILVSVSPKEHVNWESYLKQQLGNDWQKLGTVGSSDAPLRVFTADSQLLIEVTIKQMSDRYWTCLERRLTL